MFPPLSIVSFYIITSINGYKPLSDSIYYQSVSITSALTLIKGIATESNGSFKLRFGGSFLAATIGTSLVAIMGHNTGRAIRELTTYS